MQDFVIFYEHKVRELEAATLIYLYLTKMGYKGKILYVDSNEALFTKTRMVVVPYLYNDENIYDFGCFPFCKVDKVLNLQYEQVFSNKDDVAFDFMPTENAIKAKHIAWGKHTYQKLITIGVAPKNIYRVGHPAVDFNMSQFDSIYLDKQRMAKRFNLDPNKKWFIYFSNFAYTNMFKGEIEQSSDFFQMDLSDEIRKQIQMQTEIIKWMKTSLVNHPELEFIYRPHPHERVVREIKKLEKEYSNFKCINELSIRQWLHVSEIVGLTYSTSIVDVYYAKKQCLIMRPLITNDDDEVVIYNDAKIISDYEEFEKAINMRTEFPIKSEIIHEYYDNHNGDTCYKIAQIIASIITSESEFPFSAIAKRSKAKLIKKYIYFLLTGISRIIDLSPIAPKFKRGFYYAHKEQKQYKKEIKEYINKFEPIVNREINGE